MASTTKEQFPEAAHHWDLDTLYKDLASAKGKHLTPMEKLHLRGLLFGHSPGEIAEKLHKSPKVLKLTSVTPCISMLRFFWANAIARWRTGEMLLNGLRTPDIKVSRLLNLKVIAYQLNS